MPLAFKEETPATQCLTHAKCKRCTAGLLVVILMLAPLLAGQVGATYYVSKKGSDSDPGTMHSLQ